MTSNKSITGVFVKRDYPLNIKIEGEGTVEEKIVPNPSGREYPHGTTVELTPKPKEGWEFDSWSGDLSGNESPKRIKVDKQKNVTVKFKESLFSYTKKTILLTSTKFSPSTVESSMRIVSAAFIYKDNAGNIFSFHPGNPALTGIPQPWSIENVPPASSQILKKVNGFVSKKMIRLNFGEREILKLLEIKWLFLMAMNWGLIPFHPGISNGEEIFFLEKF
jgi:hypothetical protein